MKTQTTTLEKILIGIILFAVFTSLVSCSSKSAEKVNKGMIEQVNVPTYEVFISGTDSMHWHDDRIWVNAAGNRELKHMVDSCSKTWNVHPDNVFITLHVNDNQRYFRHVLR
jgi:hypothetical protein